MSKLLYIAIKVCHNSKTVKRKMSAFNLLLLVSIISTYYLASDALIGESIITTQLADKNQFSYQAAIMGKNNGSDEPKLQCGAGLISSKHALCAAQCFIDEDGNLKTFTFFVVVGEVNLKSRNIVLRLIFRIFLPGPGGYKNNDISVAELLVEIMFDENPNLSTLHIPRSSGKYDTPGLVAGYGWNWIKNKNVLDEHGYLSKTIIDYGTTDFNLRYEQVKIDFKKICIVGEDLDRKKYICGKMRSIAFHKMDPEYPVEYNEDNEPILRRRGLCVFDQGSPLVMIIDGRQVVLGVASSNNEYCESETFGDIFTDVAVNYRFISGVLKDDLAYGTLFYENRLHVLNNEIRIDILSITD